VGVRPVDRGRAGRLGASAGILASSAASTIPAGRLPAIGTAVGRARRPGFPTDTRQRPTRAQCAGRTLNHPAGPRPRQDGAGGRHGRRFSAR